MTDGLLPNAEIDIVHVNTEFLDIDSRASDHDPVVASFTFANFSNNVINGTASRDHLTGTDDNDLITGFQGRDKITGNGGNDTFVYTSLVDAGDIITDFEVGMDKIDLSQVLESVGFGGGDPIAFGYIGFRSRRRGTILTIDPDGISGDARSRSLLLAEDITTAALNNPENFIFN